MSESQCSQRVVWKQCVHRRLLERARVQNIPIKRERHDVDVFDLVWSSVWHVSECSGSASGTAETRVYTIAANACSDLNG